MRDACLVVPLKLIKKENVTEFIKKNRIFLLFYLFIYLFILHGTVQLKGMRQEQDEYKFKKKKNMFFAFFTQVTVSISTKNRA